MSSADIIIFPGIPVFRRPNRPLPNSSRLEVMFEFLDPLAPVRRKEMILLSKCCDLIDEQETSLSIGSWLERA